jgi:membrane dipeptidase
MVNFYNGFVTCQDTATVDDVVKHFEHIKQIIGVDNIGIGADYDGVPRYIK